MRFSLGHGVEAAWGPDDQWKLAPAQGRWARGLNPQHLGRNTVWEEFAPFKPGELNVPLIGADEDGHRLRRRHAHTKEEALDGLDGRSMPVRSAGILARLRVVVSSLVAGHARTRMVRPEGGVRLSLRGKNLSAFQRAKYRPAPRKEEDNNEKQGRFSHLAVLKLQGLPGTCQVRQLGRASPVMAPRACDRRPRSTGMTCVECARSTLGRHIEEAPDIEWVGVFLCSEQGAIHRKRRAPPPLLAIHKVVQEAAFPSSLVKIVTALQ
ncbi:MAG: hypothetical protein ACE5JX_04125 [Acidobacteriota bacterium]